MTGYDVEPTTTEAPYLLGIAIDLQVDELADERGDGGLQEGIARGDVDLVDIFGQTVDDSLQEPFVTEHDGRATTSSDALGREPLGDIAGLDVFRGSRDIGDLFWGYLVGILIKDGFARLFEATEEHLLHLLQQVEADEDIGIVIELQGFVGSHLTIEGTFVAELLGGQLCIVGMIDVTDMTPQAQEPLFEFAVVVVGEVAEEAAYHLALFVGEIRHVVKFVDITEVGKDLIRRSHVLIEVVEVGQQQLSPAVEVVERFVDARTLDEAFVELTDEQDGVGNLQR